MIFAVVWKKSAEDLLADLWVQHEDYRGALSHAANQIDAILRVDPLLKGDPYFGQTRILQVPPLGVMYRVFESDRLVRIAAAWYIPLYTTDGFA
jgi:hypothetical protein